MDKLQVGKWTSGQMTNEGKKIRPMLAVVGIIMLATAAAAMIYGIFMLAFAICGR